MYEQKQNYKREEERLEVAANADPHPADAGVVGQEETLPRPLPSRAGNGYQPSDGTNGDGTNGDERHLQNLPSSGGGGGGPDCSSCKRNFWTSVLNAIIKVATIVLAGLGLQGFKDAE